MDTASSTYGVHKCSKCAGDKEYYCLSCSCDLCPQCEEKHVKDLKTIDHDVVLYRDKINNIPTQEFCVKHPSQVYRKYCELCKLPVCYHCRKHRHHSQLDVKIAFKTKRQQHRETIHSIKSDALFYRPVLLSRIKADEKTCHTKFSLYQSEMLAKAQTMHDFIDKVLYDLLNNVFRDFNFKHRCFKQKLETIGHIVSLQRYEHKYVQPAFTFSALQFLSSIKKDLSKIHLTLHTSQLSMTESLNNRNVIESLSAIQITEKGSRRVENEFLLKLTSGTEFHQSLALTGVDACYHTSCVTLDRVCVSDKNNIVLTDTTGVSLYDVADCSNTSDTGLHTVNSEGELFYIDRKYNINKLSKDMITTKLMKITDFSWTLLSVYCSLSSGDLLIGTYRKKTRTGHIIRRSQNGQLALIVQHDITGLERYSGPRYLTENQNGDVVVSDYISVVVTECGGSHRFVYTGHPSGSRLWTRGICTDALSHILVCDGTTNTVQMIDRDGQFLSHLLIRPSGIFRPRGLGYDVNTHRLWVGSLDNNTVVIYRYLARQDDLTDLNPVLPGLTESLREIQIKETENTRHGFEGNQCQLKLMSPPKFYQSLKLTDVKNCYHISCVTSDQVWISNDKNKLIFIDPTGVSQHRVWDLCSDKYGLHTVNSESELIYIDRNYNIRKLSRDMNTTTTFIERTDLTWEPRCVHWSSFTGDLLVGMCTRKPKKCKVTRYNHRGQLTQTVQYDSKGLELYSRPLYLTENTNGDVVVSDFTAVVVTDCSGKYRFTYNGHPSGSELQPRGVCTDALSHILVCDVSTKTVHMLDRNGQFLSHLLTGSQEIGDSCGLSYDINTHRLLVGSEDNNTVVICRYITKQDALRDERMTHSDGDAIFSPT